MTRWGRDEWKNLGASFLVAFVLMLLMWIVSGCRTHKETTHTFQKDSTTTFSPGEVIVPEHAEEFDFDFIELCDSIAAANIELQDALAKKNEKAQQEYFSKPITIKKTKGNTTLTVSVDASGKGKIECREQEWKAMYDSLYKATTVRERDKTIVATTVYPWDYTWWKIACGVLAGMIALMLVIYHFNYRK